MRYLNVAEKPSVAKSISNILSQGQCRSRPGLSKYNPIYEFNCSVQHQNNCQMTFTSLTGHIMELDFEGDTGRSNWNSVSPNVLFTVPVYKKVKEDNKNIQKTLEREIVQVDGLILWLDCDREGENIAFEVIDICTKKKRSVSILRAHFSAIIPQDIQDAVNNLTPPNLKDSQAVDARSEIDLRIGCAFTRFQTLLLKNSITNCESIISYGPCQFPTLGFVVERYIEIKNFVSEPFWSLCVKIPAVQSNNIFEKKKTTKKNDMVSFSWERNRLFDQYTANVLYMLSYPYKPIVSSIRESNRSKYRPIPLNTVELQKRSARFLKIGSDECMKIAEELYRKGYISYPRTETDSYKSNFNINALINMQTQHPLWGPYASELLTSHVTPRAGKHDDNAHPPIHPTKLLLDTETQFSNIDINKARRIYELITRHFLACISKDALGSETEITLKVGEEFFHNKSLMVKERNYLYIYIYDFWTESSLPLLKEGDELHDYQYIIEESKTKAPELLTESELITRMDTEGIGTDATIAEHIHTILNRKYAIKNSNQRFQPTSVGVALVEGYVHMGHELYRPYLRAHMENECKKISQGSIFYKDVINECISEMSSVFSMVEKAKHILKQVFQQVYTCHETDPNYIPPPIPPSSHIVPLYIEDEQDFDPNTQPVNTSNINTSGPTYNIHPPSSFQNTGSAWLKPISTSTLQTPSIQTNMSMNMNSSISQNSTYNNSSRQIPYNNSNLMNNSSTLNTSLANTLSHSLSTCSSTPIIVINNTSQVASNASLVPQNTNNNPTNISSQTCINTSSTITNQSTSQNAVSNSTQTTSQSLITNFPTCLCNLPAKQFTVQKEGPNKGRDFYSCGNPDRNNRCKFFAWLDDNRRHNGSQSISTNITSNTTTPIDYKNTISNIECFYCKQKGHYANKCPLKMNGTNTSSSTTENNYTSSTVRKCSNCHQPGHTCRNCPQKKNSYNKGSYNNNNYSGGYYKRQYDDDDDDDDSSSDSYSYSYRKSNYKNNNSYYSRDYGYKKPYYNNYGYSNRASTNYSTGTRDAYPDIWEDFDDRYGQFD